MNPVFEPNLIKLVLDIIREERNEIYQSLDYLVLSFRLVLHEADVLTALEWTLQADDIEITVAGHTTSNNSEFRSLAAIHISVNHVAQDLGTHSALKEFRIGVELTQMFEIRTHS